MALFNQVLEDGFPKAIAMPTAHPERGLIGEIKPWAGWDLPDGFLWCDGTVVDVSTNSDYHELGYHLSGNYGVSFETDGTFVAHGSTTNGSDTITIGDLFAEVGHMLHLRVGNSSFPVMSAANYPGCTRVPVVVLAKPTGSTYKIGLFGSTTPLVAEATSSSLIVGGSPLTPDLRGRVPVGRDNMNGSDANRLTTLDSDGDILGVTGGAERHTLTLAEMPAHTHSLGGGVNTVTRQSGGSNTAGVGRGSTGSNGSNSPHNNLQPLQIINYIIRAR